MAGQHVVAEGRVGPASAADGGDIEIRLTRDGAQTTSDLHGRFYETNYRSALFSGGMGLTAINNATYTASSVSVSSTITSVAGVWNPSTSTVNLVILQAVVGLTMTAATSTGGAPFVWASSVGNTAISTGNTPLNRRTLALSGSSAKDLTNVAPTGITNALVVRHASTLGGGSSMNFSFVGTAVGAATEQVTSVENIDGGIIVPPGGVLALLATTTPVAHSATSSLLWEEVAV